MALSYAIRGRGDSGEMFTRIVDITLDASYAANGYTLDPKGMGFGANGVILAVNPVNNPGFFGDFDPSSGKLRIRDASGAAGTATPEVTNNLAALNGVVLRCIVWGKGSPG